MFSDTICPWCYIGFNRLNLVIQKFSKLKFKVIWRPFQLNPKMPKEGLERKKYLISKFGSQSEANLIYKKIEEEGINSNIFFQFNKIFITPNSFLSHKLLAYAHDKQKQSETLNSIFFQYFIEGADIGNKNKLLEIAMQNKIYDDELDKYLTSNEDNENLLNEENQARTLGINGVPCFIFNKSLVINGVQPTENYIHVIKSISKNVL